jgi:hypothetical protein
MESAFYRLVFGVPVTPRSVFLTIFLI